MRAPAIAYSQLWRIATGVLVAVSRGSLLVLVVALLFFETRFDNPLRLLRTFVAISLAPGMAAWLLARAFAATVALEGGMLVIQRRDQRIEIPCDAIVDLVPWTIPLPAGGLWLRLRSGRRFGYGLQVPDPSAFAEALADAGAAEGVRATSQHPAALYARSQAGAPRRWFHPLLTFVAFALVPAVPLFRLHQWIAYGGTFGEYYTYGLQAYLLGFAIYWVTFTIYLVLYAAVLRATAEIVVVVTVWSAPGWVRKVRRIVEMTRRILYFGGIPVFLVQVALLS
jgi:apolipoprotein N-acyltransferase